MSKNYIRGPYKKNYREKYHSKQESSSEEITEMIKDLETFRNYVNEKYKKTHYKSKIVENLQGLLDCLRKAEKREKNYLQNKIAELEAKIKRLEENSLESLLNMATTEVDLTENSNEIITNSAKDSAPVFWYQSYVHPEEGNDLANQELSVSDNGSH